MATISVRVNEVFMTQSGEKDGREWIRGGFAGAVLDDVSRTLAFSTFGKKKTAIIETLKVGDVVIVEYQPESRKFMDKWYTELRLTDIMVAGVVPSAGNDNKTQQQE